MSSPRVFVYKEIYKILHSDDKHYAEEDSGFLVGNYYEHYYEVSRGLKPRFILELGVRYGYSATAMLLGSPGAAYLGVDFNEVTNRVAEANLSRFSGYVTLATLDTQKLLTWGDVVTPVLKKYGLNRVDLVHIDGQHDPTALIYDLNLLRGLFHETGPTILVDDVNEPYLAAVTKVWCSQSGYTSRFVPTTEGLFVLRKI